LLVRVLFLAIVLAGFPAARPQAQTTPVGRATVYFDANPLFSERGVSALPAAPAHGAAASAV
jgi:hypothetical protein